MKASILLSLLLVSAVTLSSFVPVLAIVDPSVNVGFDAPASGIPIIPIFSTAAPSISSASPPVSHLSSSAAAVQPSKSAYPLNLTLPFSPAPSASSVRLLDGTYYLVNNNTLAEVSVSKESWSAATVAAQLEQLVGDESQWQRQQKQLARHVRRVNRHYSDCSTGSNSTAACSTEHGYGSHDGHKDKHDKHHNKGNSMMSFYLRHAQCRACVQSNVALLKATHDIGSTALPYLASYQPAAVMKWCTLSTPKLSSEQSPLVSSAPLADWEGVCIPAETQCPSATIDMNVLSTSTCAADEPVTKQSCTLCVLDGYHWHTGQRAFDNADNYAGQCVAPSTPLPASNGKHYRVSVTELDSCPSVVASMQTARQFHAMAGSFGLFVAVIGFVLCFSCLRACCVARKNRRVALMRLANAQVVSEPSSFSVGVVPAVSSSPAPSAPPAAGYPAAVAAAQDYQEPLLSSGLNPPRMSMSALYPQLQGQRMPVAQPYAYRI